MAAVFIPCASAQQNAAPPAGFSLSAELGGGYVDEPGKTQGLYDLGVGEFTYTSPFIDFGATAHVTNDGKYGGSEGWMHKIGDQYFMLDKGYTRLHYGGLAFEGGYLKPLSSIETPYEVFLNPLAPSTLGMALSWQDHLFQYESRWIGVNLRSSNTYKWGDPATKAITTWLDKGVNYRLIALKFGDLRIGYEESSVYLRGFDPNYFFSPLPSVLTNSILTLGNNPWTQGKNGLNDNSLMGLFGDYRSGPLYAQAQLLVDDINLNFLFPSGSSLASNNLNKLAWSIGGKYTFPFGTIGFWHGGATAHTYAATRSDYSVSGAYDANTIPYEYMYYPTVSWNGNPIDSRDSNIGFQWGENALAFRITFDTDLFSDLPWAFALASSLEYVINGSKSPDNPWHEYTHDNEIPQRIQLFNVGGPETLEQVLILHVGASKKLGDFSVRAALDIGGDFNAPDVSPVTVSGSNEPSLLKPVSGNHKLILALELGARYTYTQGAH